MRLMKMRACGGGGVCVPRSPNPRSCVLTHPNTVAERCARRALNVQTPLAWAAAVVFGLIKNCMVSCCIKSVVETGTDERDLDWDLDLGIGYFWNRKPGAIKV